MTEIENNDAFIRQKCGDRKCTFKFNKRPCVYGKVSVPNDDIFRDIDCPHCNGTGYEPITLADVLMALHELDKFKGMPRMISSGGVMYEHGKVIMEWNLTKSYSEQSEETRFAIGRLLQD